MKQNKVSTNIPNNAFTMCLKICSAIAVTVTAISFSGVFLFDYLLDGQYLYHFAILCIAILFIGMELVAPIFLVKHLVKPLKQVAEASSELAKGNLEVSTVYKGNVSEIKELFDNFNVMSRELAGISTLRSDFVSNVSHEFKTPLATIEGYAMLLQDTSLSDDERQEYIDLLLKAVKRLSELVGNVLLINKLENNNYNVSKSMYRLDEQINQTLLFLSAEWERKNINFDLSLEEITYNGAETLLERVWANLISNAIKYSENGGKIKVGLHEADHKIIFEIEDEGEGIDEKDLPHIFEKFYQADTKHKSEGNGLGLAQVYNIIKKTENEISVVSQKGKGSKFTVVLF